MVVVWCLGLVFVDFPCAVHDPLEVVGALCCIALDHPPLLVVVPRGRLSLPLCERRRKLDAVLFAVVAPLKLQRVCSGSVLLLDV